MNNTSVETYDYFYGNEVEYFQFYRIPRLLFTDDRFKRVSSDAKILYGLLLDRSGLSHKNNWRDEDGRIFIYFTQEEAMEMLNCGVNKIISVYAELDGVKGVGLIERKKQGLGQPTKIYVKNFCRLFEENKNSKGQDLLNTKAQTFEKQKSKALKSKGLDLLKTKANHTDINQTNINHTDINQSYQQQTSQTSTTQQKNLKNDKMDKIDKQRILGMKEYIKEKLGYEGLIIDYPNQTGMIDDMISIITEVMTSKKETITISGEVFTTDAVKERFSQLDEDHIKYILDCLEQNQTTIKNIKAYLRTTLYNAPITYNTYFEQQFNQIMRTPIRSTSRNQEQLEPHAPMQATDTAVITKVKEKEELVVVKSQEVEIEEKKGHPQEEADFITLCQITTSSKSIQEKKMELDKLAPSWRTANNTNMMYIRQCIQNNY